MSLESMVADALVAVATDYKQLRTWLTGSSSGTLSGLNTSDKSSIVAAINEVKSGNSGAPPAASESTAGVVELATLTEVAGGVDTTRAVTAAGVRQEREALKADILGGVGPAYDTLKELYDLALAAEESADITSLTTLVGTKANAADVYTKTQIGDITTDLVAIYNTAKA